MCPAKNDSGTAVYTDAELARERHCRTKDCACDHRGCYDGWLDPLPGSPEDDGLARRCPRCAEARDMAEELAEDAKAAKRRGRRGW